MLHLEPLVSNRRVRVGCCHFARRRMEELNVAAELVPGHLHRARINTSRVGCLVTHRHAVPMEAQRSYHLAVTGQKYPRRRLSESAACVAWRFWERRVSSEEGAPFAPLVFLPRRQDKPVLCAVRQTNLGHLGIAGRKIGRKPISEVDLCPCNPD